MLTFFEYLRNRAYESIIHGANEALEFLEKEKLDQAAGTHSEFTELPRNRRSIDFQASTLDEGIEPHGDIEDEKSSDDQLQAPRRRGRPRRDSSNSK